MTKKEKLEHMHNECGRAKFVLYKTPNVSNNFGAKAPDVSNDANYWKISCTTLTRSSLRVSDSFRFQGMDRDMIILSFFTYSLRDGA